MTSEQLRSYSVLSGMLMETLKKLPLEDMLRAIEIQQMIDDLVLSVEKKEYK